MNSVHLVNRVDKLTLEYIDRHCLLQYADYNHLMNSFVLRIIFCNGNNKSIAKVTLQLFLSRGSAMCFTCNFTINLFYELFYLLNTKYGIKVKTCSLCTSVWSYHLLSRIGELSKFYGYLIKRFFTVEYEPELFPCITLSYKNTTIRLFHTGKVVLLGVRCVEQVSEIVQFLSDAYFDYSLSCNFDNF